MLKGENLSLEREAQATAEALEFADILGLSGLVVLVGGKVKGFVLGERLNQETSVCHFEKADSNMEGLSQLLAREFNRTLFTDCTYVNREQDLGDEGLRMAKSTYHPIELITKYRITPPTATVTFKDKNCRRNGIQPAIDQARSFDVQSREHFIRAAALKSGATTSCWA